MASLPLDTIVYREDLYPRIDADPQLIQRYSEDLSVLPPIEVNQHNELIDGYHRWSAHKRAGAAEVPVTVTETKSDVELLALACRRNAAHGYQLKEADKQKNAIRLYAGGTGYADAEIAAILSVSERRVRSYLSDEKAKTREERRNTTFSMWLACYTEQEIADTLGVHKDTVSEDLADRRILETLPKSDKLLALHDEADWAPPLFDIWNPAKNNNAVKHFGNTPVEFVDNLLYLYTQPFEVVIDPCAGGGSTVDICKHRLRRYWASDRKPIPGREKDIRQHDLATDGLSGPSRWGDVALVYLDPPYWKQAEGQYSKDPSDLANMPLEQFTETLVGIIHGYAAKLRAGAHIACIISPTQWPNEDKATVYHDLDLARLVGKKARLVQRVLCPYSTQQYNGTQVDIAKDRKLLMALTRTLLVWETG